MDPELFLLQMSDTEECQQILYKCLTIRENMGFYYSDKLHVDPFMVPFARIIKDHLLNGTVDIDVLDPSYAPSVGTPSPCGITPFDLEEIMGILSIKDTVGLDVVEVSADKIGDLTSINAAQVIYDYLCLKS